MDVGAKEQKLSTGGLRLASITRPGHPVLRALHPARVRPHLLLADSPNADLIHACIHIISNRCRDELTCWRYVAGDVEAHAPRDTC